MAAFDMSTLRVVATGLKFPEGPIAFDDGSITVVEIEGDSVACTDADGSITRFPAGRGPNGSALGPDGALYVCDDGGLQFMTDEHGIRFPFNLAEDHTGGTVLRLDLATGEAEPVFTESDGERLGGLNDIVFDVQGGAYIVDTSTSRVHYADPIVGTIMIATTAVEMPNGAGLSPDGRTLYVSETYGTRILAFDVTGPGWLGEPRVHYACEEKHGFDGLAIDGAGNVCVANLARSGISVISPTGELLGAFVTPEKDTFVTNICFGGADGDTAFICSAGRGTLYAVKWPWPGLRLNFAR